MAVFLKPPFRIFRFVFFRFFGDAFLTEDVQEEAWKKLGQLYVVKTWFKPEIKLAKPIQAEIWSLKVGNLAIVKTWRKNAQKINSEKIHSFASIWAT